VANAPYDVLCVGNAIVDVLAPCTDEFLDHHGLVKGTMQLVDDATAHALYADMGPGTEVSGGSAANTATGIASFGGRPAFIGKVAADQLGEVFAHDLRSAGVYYGVPPAPGGSPATARCMVLVTPDAQRTLNTFLGISAALGPDDIDEDLVVGSAVLYVEGYLWDAPGAKAAILRAMEVARLAGRKVAFTLSDPFCVERHRDEFVGLVRDRVDILFANEVEVSALVGGGGFDAAAKAVGGMVELACLTRSEKGSVIVSAGGDVVAVPAEPVASVVDTTGAGDLYAAGFLFGLVQGKPLTECARLGGAAAAEVISHLGARPQGSLADLA
jgi:sugar/nucleoside kinase (ribokinase family)